jgi:ribosomal protein S12 methylthiotransferase
MSTSKTIHFISLGCPKNRVDSEVMLGVALERNYAHVSEPENADIIVVNTCGFIDPAKKESVDTILEMAALKEAGRCDKLIVAGCLSQRHPDEMAAELPEVDHFLGSSDMLQIGNILDGAEERMLVGTPADWLVQADTPRMLSTHTGSAYVKIAEGCNRTCSFCVIPQLRGKQRSRAPRDVKREVEQLVRGGVREINLISQDTIAYGRDLPAGERASLADLVEHLAGVAGLSWLRLFYLYPEKIDDTLISLLADHGPVLPYVDMPLQHAADAMLRRMRRGHGGPRLRKLVERLRTEVPDLVFRSAFIVGHPGESDAEFEELCEFVRWAELERVGVFQYSDEESAPSHALGDKVPAEVAAERCAQLMEIARDIARNKNAQYIGRELSVLVEGVSDEHEAVLQARHAGQAPEIDGQVFLSGLEYLERIPKPGELIRVRITQSSDYDLAGDVIALEEHQLEARAAGPSARITLKVLSADNRRIR